VSVYELHTDETFTAVAVVTWWSQPCCQRKP